MRELETREDRRWPVEIFVASRYFRRFASLSRSPAADRGRSGVLREANAENNGQGGSSRTVFYRGEIAAGFRSRRPCRSPEREKPRELLYFQYVEATQYARADSSFVFDEKRTKKKKKKFNRPRNCILLDVTLNRRGSFSFNRSRLVRLTNLYKSLLCV